MLFTLIFLDKIFKKYQRFTLSGCTEIVIRKYEFVAKAPFFLKGPDLK